MKKFFTFAAMLIAAVSINAQEPIPVTCAEAAAAMPAQSGDETADVYIVTGYITNTNGTISKGQQTFYMDDVKGSQKTLQGYWCNLPAEVVEANRPLNVGDKITLTGKILNYSNTPEIKNGDVTILERATVKVDTIEATVCEALEEGSSLNDKDYSDDVFCVFGRLKGVDAVNSNGQHTFEMACGDEIFKPYNCNGAEGLELGKGDSVKVTGKLYNFGGVIEISNGTVELIEKSGQEEVIIEATVAEAVAAVKALAQGGTTDDRYAVTGFVDSIATAYDEGYGNISFFMTDNMDAPTYDFEAYRVSVTPQQAEKIVLGVKVTVTAALQRYYKAATETLDEIDLAETVAGGSLKFADESAVANVANAAQSVKRIENGQIIILRDGVRYNMLGTEIR